MSYNVRAVGKPGYPAPPVTALKNMPPGEREQFLLKMPLKEYRSLCNSSMAMRKWCMNRSEALCHRLFPNIRQLAQALFKNEEQIEVRMSNNDLYLDVFESDSVSSLHFSNVKDGRYWLSVNQDIVNLMFKLKKEVVELASVMEKIANAPMIEKVHFTGRVQLKKDPFVVNRLKNIREEQKSDCDELIKQITKKLKELNKKSPCRRK